MKEIESGGDCKLTRSTSNRNFIGHVTPQRATADRQIKRHNEIGGGMYIVAKYNPIGILNESSLPNFQLNGQ